MALPLGLTTSGARILRLQGASEPRAGAGIEARETVADGAAARAENAQPATTGARAPTPAGGAHPEERTAAPRPAPAYAPLAGSRADTRLAPPPSLTGRAPPARAAAEGHLLVKRNRLILVIPVLAAVGGTGLHHPASPQSLHFCRSSRQVKLLPMSLLSAFDTLASSVALAHRYSDDSLRPGCLMCPFCCLH